MTERDPEFLEVRFFELNQRDSVDVVFRERLRILRQTECA